MGNVSYGIFYNTWSNGGGTEHAQNNWPTDLQCKDNIY